MVRDKAAHLPTFRAYPYLYVLITCCIYFHRNSTIVIFGFQLIYSNSVTDNNEKKYVCSKTDLML